MSELEILKKGMMVKDNLVKYSIDDWEREFEDIYGYVDQERSPSDMWLLLMEDASKVAEALRKEAYYDALNALAHTFNWTCAFISRCRKRDNDLGMNINNSLSNIIWNKYPNLCSLCGRERCVCPVRRQELEELTKEEKNQKLKEIEKDLDIARHRTEYKSKTLDGFTDMLSRIYKGAHYQLTIEAIAFHFMEEVGEVSTAIRKLRESSQMLSPEEFEKKKSSLTKELEKELADVISWTMSLIHKLDYILGAGANYVNNPITKNKKEKNEKIPQTVNLKLSEVLWTAFQTPDGNTLYCPKCENRPCKCIPIPL
jgi:NTP pyrophosphatase (non-canonical NTP hydrolase)